MNNLNKFILSGVVVLGSTLGMGHMADFNTHADAHAVQKPYYTYKGYTSASSKFVLDKHFVNSLKYDNLVMNGYKITKTKQITQKEMKKDDQTFYNVSNKKANAVMFALSPKTVSTKALVNVYGQPKQKPVESAQGSVYNYQIGKKTIEFFVKDGYVYAAQITSMN
ncbi:immunodominant staphylococcal antigen IsaB family protein [Staphylococcus agnetis]|uniref:immunodominant staphylococcal antigen IsaB family protein n=1 Tax=Staphylococcus agnetis TaxID=985762 RepID=UPI000D045C9D|nr:hypothetical protein [Staphylococcus agnetis]